MAESIHEKMMRAHGAGGMRPGHSMGSKKDMKKASFEISLKGKKQIAEGTMAFVFEKPKDFKFKSGQHVRMTLIDPPETDNEGDSRFLSIASTPQGNDLVFAMRMRDTAFKRVLRQMPSGQKVLIQILLDVPHGAFALHDDPSKPAVFIVGGIGIVPVFSMIKDATKRKLPHKMYLFYSNRRPEDAVFLKELQNLAKQNSKFTFVATMTEIKKSTVSWRGETNLIDSSMLKKYLDNLELPIYYLAGLPEMVSAMKTMLTDLDVDENDIRAEEFTGFNLNEIIRTSRSNTRVKPAIVFIGLLILLMIALHSAAALSLSTSGLTGALSLDNPIIYGLIAIIAVIVAFKIKIIASFIVERGK